MSSVRAKNKTTGRPCKASVSVTTKDWCSNFGLTSWFLPPMVLQSRSSREFFCFYHSLIALFQAVVRCGFNFLSFTYGAVSSSCSRGLLFLSSINTSIFSKHLYFVGYSVNVIRSAAASGFSQLMSDVHGSFAYTPELRDFTQNWRCLFVNAHFLCISM